MASQPQSALPLVLPFIWPLSVRCHPVGQVTQEADIMLIMHLPPIQLFGVTVFVLAENVSLLGTEARVGTAPQLNLSLCLYASLPYMSVQRALPTKYPARYAPSWSLLP